MKQFFFVINFQKEKANFSKSLLSILDRSYHPIMPLKSLALPCRKSYKSAGLEKYTLLLKITNLENICTPLTRQNDYQTVFVGFICAN